MEKLYLRPATMDDMVMLFEWANDADVRDNSFNSHEISYDEHREWLEKIISSDMARIYILMQGNVPVGQVRAEKRENAWRISYSIDKAYRAQGYGKAMLQLLENIFADDIGEHFMAEVKRNNVASQIVFEELRYKKHDEDSFIVFHKESLEKYNIENISSKIGGGTLPNE